MIQYEGTSNLADDRLMGGYDYDYDSLGADGDAHPDTMPVSVWLVCGEDEHRSQAAICSSGSGILLADGHV